MLFYDNISILKEAVLFSEDDFKYRLEDFENKVTNKLLITGYTGSGKTTLSKKFNVSIVELDKVVENDKEILRISREESKEKKKFLFQKRIDAIILELLRSKKRMIIEGIQIFFYESIEDLKDHSIILVGRSAFVSALSAYKRNKKETWTKGWSKIDILRDIYDNMSISIFEKFSSTVKSWN